MSAAVGTPRWTVIGYPVRWAITNGSYPLGRGVGKAAKFETPFDADGLGCGGFADYGRTGSSRRSLHRGFSAATGMSPARWVQQARLIHAVTPLVRNTPVTTVATGLGCATPSAFTAMFRRTLGTTPTAYFTDRKAARSLPPVPGEHVRTHDG
jgi:hypothetical protein